MAGKYWKRNSSKESCSFLKDNPQVLTVNKLEELEDLLEQGHEIEMRDTSLYQKGATSTTTPGPTNFKDHRTTYKEDDYYLSDESKSDRSEEQPTPKAPPSADKTKDKGGGFKGPYNCNSCLLIFNGSQKLRTHILQVHNALLNGSSSNTQSFQCGKCPKSFTKLTVLNTHWINHWEVKPHPCPQCTNSYATTKELRIHSVKHSEERPFKCSVCSQTFKRVTELNKHDGQRVLGLQCKTCRATGFCKETKLKSHELSHKKEAKRRETFLCKICGQTLPKRERLEHIRGHHKEEGRPFRCTFCPKGFRNLASMETHMRFHTGEKPFECKICKKQFSQGSNLNTHKKVHQVPAEMFQCGICYVKMKSRLAFTRHQLTCGDKAEVYFSTYKIPIPPEHLQPGARNTHKTLYKCKSCEQTFNRKEYAIDHTFRHHLKLKMYSCNYCNSTFSHKTELQTHTRSHTDEKPFKCPHCPREFRQSTCVRQL